MSSSGKTYEIGHGRPPKATQFKKGKSANPGGRSPRRPAGLLETIDKLLLTPVRVTRDGEPRWVTTLEAILEQLWSKGIANDHRALAVYLRCQEFARQVANGPAQMTFADSDYTRSFSGYHEGSSHDE